MAVRARELEDMFKSTKKRRQAWQASEAHGQHRGAGRGHGTRHRRGAAGADAGSGGRRSGQGRGGAGSRARHRARRRSRRAPRRHGGLQAAPAQEAQPGIAPGVVPGARPGGMEAGPPLGTNHPAFTPDAAVTPGDNAAVKFSPADILSSPDWPCIQRKVPTISPAQVWDGPPDRRHQGVRARTSAT